MKAISFCSLFFFSFFSKQFFIKVTLLFSMLTLDCRSISQLFLFIVNRWRVEASRNTVLNLINIQQIKYFLLGHFWMNSIAKQTAKFILFFIIFGYWRRTQTGMVVDKEEKEEEEEEEEEEEKERWRLHFKKNKLI